MSKQGLERRQFGLWRGLAALICMALGVNMFGAGIPWSSGQAIEYGITGLSSPDSVAVDPTHGKIYVTERGKNRVLRFGYPLSSNTPVDAAEVVFGQSDFTGTSANRGGSAAANTISLPYGLAVAANGDLWVADYDNNRLLKYASAWSAASGAVASVVLGQDNFTSTASGTAANRLSHPCGLSIDSGENLWVADMSNSRVLRFANVSSKTSGASADSVLGQANFTSASSNRGGSPAAYTLSSPYGLGVSGSTLWVADSGNNRVLRFDNAPGKANGAAADGVLGQTVFTANSANMGGSISASGFSFPGGVAADLDGRVYVNDSFNHRLLIFADAALKANGGAADYYLQASSFTSSGLLSSPWHVVYDNIHHRLLIGNTGANRVEQFFNCYTTTLTMAGSPNPCITVGNPVTLTATVTTANGGPVPSGYVSFNENGSSLGTGAIDASGIATFTTTALSDSTHTLTAVLTNTYTHKGSQSASYTQVVGKYTPTLTLGASANPSTANSEVYFTATVTPPSGAPTPTGSVEFLLDDNSIATLALTSGVARWTNSTLSAGSHIIDAVYGGDSNFRSATNSLAQTVNPAGLYTVTPVANVEADFDGSTTTVYDGTYYGGVVYAGSYPPTTFFSAFRFDLSSVSGTILSASLRVRVNYKETDGTLVNPKIYLNVTEDDSCSDVTPLAAPTSYTSPAVNEWPIATLVMYDWLTNDVTTFVKSQYGGDKKASFVFRSDAASGNNYAGFDSKESSYAPELVIQTAPPDLVAPTVSSVSVPSDGTYGPGQNLDFTVNFNETVLVSGGTPRIPLTLATGGTVYATYFAGSGTAVLEFRYTVASGNLDADGVSVGTAIQANGATLEDAAGNAAVLTLNSVASTTGVLVDAVAPTITISDPSPATTVEGPVSYTVTYADTSLGAISLDSSDITLNRTSTANGTVLVAGTGATRTVTITNITGHGTLGITIASGTASDTTGNQAPASDASTTVTVNLPPVISGTVASQAVNDDATLALFNGVTVSSDDAPNQTLTCTVTLDASAKGEMTAASLTASGFADAGAGAYSLSAKASDITTAIRQLVFAPTANRVARGSTETTTFTISVTDGVFTPVTNNATTVVSTSVNHAPTAVANTIQRTATQGVKVSTTTLLANDTDPDSDTLSLTGVSGTTTNGGTIYLADSWIHYVPAAGFTNVDAFTYTVSDGQGGTATGTVTVNIKTDGSATGNQIGGVEVRGPNQYRIVFGGIPGRTYTIQYTESLSLPYTWQTVGTATASPTGLITFDDTSASPIRLYRTVYP